MSTNCIIGIVDGATGGARGILCHWDGHPERAGRTLLEHYTDPGKLGRLIALGAISSLGDEAEPPAGAPHSFDDPRPGVTVAYARDRGDALRPAISAAGVTELLRKAPCVPFAYILEGGEWTLHLEGRPAGEPLAEALARMGEQT